MIKCMGMMKMTMDQLKQEITKVENELNELIVNQPTDYSNRKLLRDKLDYLYFEYTKMREK